MEQLLSTNALME